MLGLSRRRTDRPKLAKRRADTRLETLEGRQLLSADPIYTRYYEATVLAPRTVEHHTPPVVFTHPYGLGRHVLSQLDNDGRILTGKDRQGDEWQITVHGPGVVIVTDATPNDGALDDDIDTIQIVGSNIHQTYVTGQVTSSARVVTDGTVFFNRLVAADGVASIILNGFTLAQTVLPPLGPPNNAGPEIFLPGGVGTLSFHDILAPIDLAFNDQPIDVVIGNPNEPLAVAPTIRIDSIFNTVFDSTLLANLNGVPRTIPTVNFLVNGQLHGFEILSATATPLDAASRFNFPDVGVTGRTSVRATAINRLKVHGTARNFTASRGATPFQGRASGLARLGRAEFGGNADAVGLDVEGPIHRLRFARGLGNPAGNRSGLLYAGLPDFERGYPSFGLLGGLVRANEIGSVKVAPADSILQIHQDPDFRQIGRTNSTKYFPRAGQALTSAAIVSAGSIDTVSIVGDSAGSEIKTGFDYPSFAAGLGGVRARSQIGRFRQRGDLIDSVVSASYDDLDGTYGDVDADGVLADRAGPGRIRGHLDGSLFTANTQTALNKRGVGIFARTKVGYLPPPEAPKRFRSVLARV